MRRLIRAADVVGRSIVAAVVVLVALWLAYAFGAGYLPAGPFGILIGLAILVGAGAVVVALAPGERTR